jgi:DNA-binding transcriptional ArsR family regulator
MEKAPLELPVLRLALVGFSPAEQNVIEMALEKIQAGLPWCLSSLDDADALFACGPRAVPAAGGLLQVNPGLSALQPVLLDINDTDRPLAFSLPLTAPGYRSANTFDIRKPESIRAMLVQFTGWLRPMAVKFWLASRIVHERLDLGSTVYHVSVEGRLQAVVSRRAGVGVLPIADPKQLDDAIWARRPVLADEIPGHFVQTGMAEVLWQYAMRTRRELLPAAFRSGPLYWCRAPQLRQRLFRDSHLMIARELVHASTTFSELGRRTGLPEAVLARDLSALRITGAVTQDRKQALRAAGQLPDTSAARRLGDKTAPARLTPQRA